MQLVNWSRLEVEAKHVGVQIDPSKPRESRLAVAVENDRRGRLYEAIEAMTGIPLHEYDPAELRAQMDALMLMRDHPRQFYEGFEPVDQ